MESLFYLSKDSKDDKGEKKDDKGESYNNMGEDKNNVGDGILLDIRPNVDSDVNLMKWGEVEKRVGAFVKLGLGKIADLKLIGGFITNCLVGIMFLKNLTFNTLDEAGITATNFLVYVIANSFNIISPVYFFIIFADSSVESGNLGILRLINSASTFAKSFINNSVTLVGSFAVIFVSFSIVAPVGSSVVAFVGSSIEANKLDNFFADILLLIKLLMELAPNTIYKKWSKYIFCSASVVSAKI